MSDICISWSDYHHKIEQLAVKIYQSEWQFNQIVCLARGGLRVGDILSRIYNQPLAILSTSSYNDADKHERSNLIISHQLTMTSENLGSRILLVDDLVDSGITLQQTIPWLHSYGKSSIEEIRTAVIWYKACSAIVPDYHVDYLADNPWIHQPFEYYEDITPAELAEKIS
jgi:uncharacterized protein